MLSPDAAVASALRAQLAKHVHEFATVVAVDGGYVRILWPDGSRHWVVAGQHRWRVGETWTLHG